MKTIGGYPRIHYSLQFIVKDVRCTYLFLRYILHYCYSSRVAYGCKDTIRCVHFVLRYVAHYCHSSRVAYGHKDTIRCVHFFLSMSLIHFICPTAYYAAKDLSIGVSLLSIIRVTTVIMMRWYTCSSSGQSGQIVLS